MIRRMFRIGSLLLMTATLTVLTPSQSLAASSPYNLAITPSSANVQPDAFVVYSVSVTCNSTCNVGIGASISPVVTNGPTATLAKYHFYRSGGSVLHVTAGPSTPLGTYTVTVTAFGNGTTKSVSATLIVNNFTIAANPTSVSVAAGQTAASTITLSSQNGFTGTIYYSDNEPSATSTGIACNLQPDPVTLTSIATVINSTLTCSGTPGTYDVIINATTVNGMPVRTATVTITVKNR